MLAPDGAVVASSPNVAGKPAVVQLRPGQTRHVVTPLDDDEFVAVAEGAQTPEGPRTVLVARALVDVFDATAVVTRMLIIGLPVLLVVVALTTWFAVGRALAPVEAIRREVDEISAAQLHRRVPQPKSDDEIGRLAATMNRMLVRLEDSRNSQRRFISDASHELRSPLTTIREHSEVALAHPEGTTAEELADVVLAEEMRMQRLVEDMLLLARADEHAAPQRVPVDLDDLVFEEARRLRSTTVVTGGHIGGRGGAGARGRRGAAAGGAQPRRQRRPARGGPHRSRSVRARRRGAVDVDDDGRASRNPNGSGC